MHVQLVILVSQWLLGFWLIASSAKGVATWKLLVATFYVSLLFFLVYSTSNSSSFNVLVLLNPKLHLCNFLFFNIYVVYRIIKKNWI